MSTWSRQRMVSIPLLIGLFFSLVQPTGVQSGRLDAQHLTSPSDPLSIDAAPSIPPDVRYALKNDRSSALKDLPPLAAPVENLQKEREMSLHPLPFREGREPKGITPAVRDRVLQDQPGILNMPDLGFSFAGLSNEDNANTVGFYLAPPDTMGAIGPNHYVQWVNVVFAIWEIDRLTNTASLVFGPVAGNTLWQGFGGACEFSNDGDIVVLFDETAGRWVMSQFALFASDGFHQCVAISETDDPTGAWYRYDFLASSTKINDYPKLGVWSDAYYMTANQFADGGASWGGQGVWAFERDQMLLGLPARMVYFDMFNVDPNLGGMLPSDLDGVLPPPGTPNYFIQFDDDAWGYASQDQLQIWAFSVNWSIPTASTFNQLAVLPTAPFDSQICPTFRGQCIDQPDDAPKLEDLADRLMYRLQYRNFGDHQALVVNHTVDATGAGIAGVRWYELRNGGAGWSIYQQGTYAPNDGLNRWMGSMAMDRIGNIAVGYSVSSTSTYPAIRYTGRLAGDPLGTLPQTEAQIVSGAASQVGTNRWGDYSMMTLDPTDDCTFWYTQEYVSGPNFIDWANWSTHIAAFRFPTCIAGPSGILQGTVTNAGTSAPIANALIDLGGGIMTFTDDSGFYQVLGLPTGTYTVTAEAYGYGVETAAAVEILDGVTITQDFSLTQLPVVTVTGTVTDAAHGWPLYARIDLSAYGFTGSVFTDPETGQYSVDVFEGYDYIFTATAQSPGYNAETRAVSPVSGGGPEDFALTADLQACTAPGYSEQLVYFEDFEASDGGYLTDGFTSWAWGTPTSGPGSAYSGENAWGTNLNGNYFDGEDGTITSPQIDLSAYAGRSVIVSWWQWLQTEDCCDFANLEVSNDGGSNWYYVYGPVSGSVDLDWAKHTAQLDPSFAVADFRLRFRLYTDGSITFPGFYIDDVGIGIPDSPPTYFNENFEANDGGYADGGTNSSWAWGTPTRGPTGAHSGLNAWATNLNGNYNDDEDSAITSPPIDLSAAAGQYLTISWWMWLQTESGYDTASVDVYNGISWTPVFTGTGVTTFDWVQYGIFLDPSFAVPDFRVRFRLQSDNTVTYPGFYVDDVVVQAYSDVLPTIPCVPQPGGLLVGNVTDANTSDGLNQAVVSRAGGGFAISGPTPDDAALADGFYTLFSPSGPQTVSATLRNYGTDVQTPTVVLSDTVRQDFSLSAGQLAYDPASLETTLEMGASTTLNFDLSNQGGLPASFEIQERDGGRTPAQHLGGAPQLRIPGTYSPGPLVNQFNPVASLKRPVPRPDVPPWIAIANYPIPIMDNTAAELDGRIYSVGGMDGSTFSLTSSLYIYDPTAGGWTSGASMSAAREKPAAAFVDGLLYVVGGWDDFGSPNPMLEIYDPGANSWSTGAPIPTAYAAAAAVSMGGELYVIGGCDAFTCGSTDVFRYDPAGDAWTRLAPYPEVTSWAACAPIDGLLYCAGGVSDLSGESNHTYVYDPDSDVWSPRADMAQTQWGTAYTAAAGKLWISSGVTANFSEVTNQTFVYDPEADAWAADANANQAVYRGGSACGFYKIGGSIGSFSPIPDSELYPGLADCGESVDVPWLTTTPITGTLQTNQSLTIDVFFDAGVPEVDQPGDYLASLKFKEDTPYTLEALPVTMTVTPPATWGKLDGTVTGLGRCDVPGDPLVSANVAVGTVTSLSTTAGGSYVWWLEAGSYTLTVTAQGYVSQVVEVNVTAGSTTTTNFDLRLDAPCGAASPPAFEASTLAGTITTQQLTLANTGAGEMTFQFLESALALPPSPAAPVVLTPPVVYSQPVQPGVTSILSQAGGYSAVRSTPRAPDSNWFAALDLPGGLVRYAAAQCYSQPDSYYVTSGINSNFAASTRTWRYDAAENTWTELAPIPNGTESPSAVCYQGKLYVMGGSGTNQFYIYDIATNSWSGGPPLPRNVEGASAGAWDGKIFLVGGDDDFFPASGISDEVDIYDIVTGDWVGLGAPMPVPVANAGYFAQGQYLYVVGGWGVNAPDFNANATQRYDMPGDVWEIGPEFTSARADFALAATVEGLYAIGGDATGGFFFDATTVVERLDLASWQSGTWTDLGDPLPAARTSNNAGFCTAGLFPAQVWSVGGFDSSLGIVTGDNRFLGRPGESCYSIYSDIPWLGQSPAAGVVPGDSTADVPISFDASSLSPGVYTATLVLLTNEPNLAEVRIPVSFTVTAATYGVAVTPTVDTILGSPGTTPAYKLLVTNTGTIPDTYSIGFTGNTWFVDAPPDTGQVQPGASVSLTVAVSIPVTALNGDSDTASLVITSVHDTSFHATSTLTTYAYWFRKFLPVLAQMQTVPPGQLR